MNFLTTGSIEPRDKRRPFTSAASDSGRHGSDSVDIGVTACFVRRRLERHKSLTGSEGKRSDGSITEIAVMAVSKSFGRKVAP